MKPLERLYWRHIKIPFLFIALGFWSIISPQLSCDIVAAWKIYKDIEAERKIDDLHH